MPEDPIEGEPKGDTRSTAEYVKAEFGVDIETERQAIEAECERHFALIQEIADSLGLTPDYINGATDEEFIEKLKATDLDDLGKALFKDRYIEISDAISSEPREYETAFELDEHKNELTMNPKYMIGLPAAGGPAKEDNGRIDRWVTHIHAINDFAEGQLRIVTAPEEPTVEIKKYLNLNPGSPEYAASYPYIVGNCWEALTVLELMEESQENDELREALHLYEWQESKQLQNSGFARNAFVDYERKTGKRLSADTFDLLERHRPKNSPKSEKYREALSAQARLVTALSLILVARYMYIARKARNGEMEGITFRGEQRDSLGRKRETFEVSEDYSFPKDGTRAAIESEMPWLLKFMKH